MSLKPRSLKRKRSKRGTEGKMFYPGVIIEEPTQGAGEAEKGQVWVMCPSLYDTRPIPMWWLGHGAIRPPAIDSMVVVCKVNDFTFAIAYQFHEGVPMFDVLTARPQKVTVLPAPSEQVYMEVDDERGFRLMLPDEDQTGFVRWDELKVILTNVFTSIGAICTALSVHFHSTAWGPSGPPNNAATYTSEKSNIDAEKTKVTNDDPATYKESGW